jgi:hypothetical protein
MRWEPCALLSRFAPPSRTCYSAPNICSSPPSADDVHVVLHLDRAARLERDRRAAPRTPVFLVLPARTPATPNGEGINYRRRTGCIGLGSGRRSISDRLRLRCIGTSEHHAAEYRDVAAFVAMASLRRGRMSSWRTASGRRARSGSPTSARSATTMRLLSYPTPWREPARSIEGSYRESFILKEHFGPRTTAPVQHTMRGRTQTRGPSPRRLTSLRHLVRALSGHRTNGHNCSAVFLPSRCGRRMRPAQNRGHLQRRAGEAGMSPDCRVHSRRGTALGRSRARRNRQAERSRQQSESCHRPAPQRYSDQQVKHSRWTHRKRRGRLCNAASSSFLPSGVAPMMISRHCAVSSRRACT